MSETVRKHREFLFPAVAMYYREPVALVRGEGMYVWDDQDRRYLDCFGGVLTVSVGHANPAVVEAIVQQVRLLQHASTLYANQPQSDLAEKLAEVSPAGMRRSFFTASGTEADDTAVMAAKLATCRHEVVVLRHSYSGRSPSALTAAGHSTWRPLPAQVPGFVHAPAPYCYRCPFRLKYPECGLACAEELEEVIATCTTGEIAAFMAEPILGVGGFIVPPPGYFERAVEIARSHGGLFIADEVQTAWGRTGERWWGIEHTAVTPDIITSAKGMGNGAPIGVTITTDEIAASYPGLTFSTFGGNPVSCAAALAVIRVIEQEDLRSNAARVGTLLREGLERLHEKHPTLGDVRGKGLMQGLELVKDRETKAPFPEGVAAVFEETKRRGVLIGKGGLHANVIRLGMPLIARPDHVEELLASLDAGLAVADGLVV